MVWVLKIPHRLRDVCEVVIMLKVLHHLKLFFRRFFDNEYMVQGRGYLGLEEAEKEKGVSFLFIRKMNFKPFQTESYFASLLCVQPALLAIAIYMKFKSYVYRSVHTQLFNVY